MMAMNQSLMLNPLVWKRLPEDLLQFVLSKVTFLDLVRFRLVSKHWKSVLVTRAAQLTGKASSSCDLLYVDPSNSRNHITWLRFHVSGGRRWNVFPLHSFPSNRLPVDMILRASEGGLLFFTLETKFIREFLVWNPLTGQHKLLPPPSAIVNGLFRCSTVAFGVVVNAEKGNYKIVVGGVLDSGSQNTLVYDSLKCSWRNTTPAPVPYADLDADKALSRGICCNGNLYFQMAYSRTSSNGEIVHVEAVVKYDVQNDIWSQVKERSSTTLSRWYRFGQTVSETGEVLLTTMTSLKENGPPTGIGPDILDQLSGLNKFRMDYSQHELLQYERSQYRGQGLRPSVLYYFSFKQGDIFYRFLWLLGLDCRSNQRRGVRITEVNGHRCQEETFHATSWVELENWMGIWCFSPSLTAMI